MSKVTDETDKYFQFSIDTATILLVNSLTMIILKLKSDIRTDLSSI